MMFDILPPCTKRCTKCARESQQGQPSPTTRTRNLLILRRPADDFAPVTAEVTYKTTASTSSVRRKGNHSLLFAHSQRVNFCLGSASSARSVKTEVLCLYYSMFPPRLRMSERLRMR